MDRHRRLATQCRSHGDRRMTCVASWRQDCFAAGGNTADEPGLRHITWLLAVGPSADMSDASDSGGPRGLEVIQNARVGCDACI